MGLKRNPNELSVEELEQLLYQKKRAERRQRLVRMKSEGRLIEIAGLPPPNPKTTPPPPPKTAPTPTQKPKTQKTPRPHPPKRKRQGSNQSKWDKWEVI
jgi:hypothetical protein